jgi:hypothetical protein
MAERPSLQQLFEGIEAVWNAARGPKPMPKRTDIDPVKFRTLLPYVALIDVVHGDELDFRYRLLGQQVVNGLGRNITGNLHTQHLDPNEADWPFFKAYKRCVASRTAQNIEHEFRNSNETLVRMRARVWPLSDDGELVTGLLGGGQYLEPTFS